MTSEVVANVSGLACLVASICCLADAVINLLATGMAWGARTAPGTAGRPFLLRPVVEVILGWAFAVATGVLLS